VRAVRYTIFLPYADQDSPPLDVKAICTKIERRLDALIADVTTGTDGRRLGIIVSSSRVANQAELLRAVEPVLPDGGLFADPSY
jgi:hypothetical protein